MIIGFLVVGPLLDRVNIYLMIGSSLLVIAALYGAVPWCGSLAALLGVLSPVEFFNAHVDVGEPLALLYDDDNDDDDDDDDDDDELVN